MEKITTPCKFLEKCACLLTVFFSTYIEQGDIQPELVSVMLAVARDETRWTSVRKNALKVWLKMGAAPQAALALLDDITDGRVSDQDDELAGLLLRHLYPGHIDPKTLLRYPLHLILQVLQNSNGLNTMTGMLAAILTGDERCIKPMRKIQSNFTDCLAPLIS